MVTDARSLTTGIQDTAGTDGIGTSADTAAPQGNDTATQSALLPSAISDQLPMLTADEFANVTDGQQTAFANPEPGPYNPGNPSDTRLAAVKYAEGFVGTPYVYGGSAPGGFDCSGLTQFVAGKFGVKLPRVSTQQMTAGTHVDVSQLEPGDIVILNGGEHVALYAGNGQIVEAPHTGTNVRVRKLGKNEQAYGVHLKYPGENSTTINHYHAASVDPGPQNKPGILSGRTLNNARAIVEIGRGMGASNRDIAIALMTAQTESGMSTDAVGDHGLAVGLFQQHSSWGIYAQRTNAAASAMAFYRALLAVRNRGNMTPWQAAQAVQRSATSDGSNYRANWAVGQHYFQTYGF